MPVAPTCKGRKKRKLKISFFIIFRKEEKTTLRPIGKGILSAVFLLNNISDLENEDGSYLRKKTFFIKFAKKKKTRKTSFHNNNFIPNNYKLILNGHKNLSQFF